MFSKIFNFEPNNFLTLFLIIEKMKGDIGLNFSDFKPKNSYRLYSYTNVHRITLHSLYYRRIRLLSCQYKNNNNDNNKHKGYDTKRIE